MNGAAAFTVLLMICGLTAAGFARWREAEPGLHDAYARTQALAAAAIDAARRERVLWLHTETLLARAARRAAAGDTPMALRLARAAHREASLARNQARLEAARYGLELGRSTLPSPAVSALERALHAHDGRAALALARRFGLVD